jgi:hypothetical protein
LEHDLATRPGFAVVGRHEPSRPGRELVSST